MTKKTGVVSLTSRELKHTWRIPIKITKRGDKYFFQFDFFGVVKGSMYKSRGSWWIMFVTPYAKRKKRAKIKSPEKYYKNPNLIIRKLLEVI